MAGFLLPLFFLIGLPLGLVSAFHAPTPHDLALKIVGPSEVVSKVTSSLDDTEHFAATQTDVASEARSSVHSRDAVGAIKVTVKQSSSSAATSASSTGASSTEQAKPTYTVTTYIASAGGKSAAAAVTAVGEKVAKQFGVTTKVVDVAPTSSEDSLGTTLFYLLTYSSLGGYLVIIVLTQVMPDARLRVRFGAVAATAVALPLFVFGLASIFIGDYGQSFGAIMSLLGVMAVSVFTVGTLAIVLQSLLKNAAIFGVMAMVVMLNFPSAGGAVPASMLPPFWQFMHSFWFGAGAFESFRSIVYFDGEQLGRWLPQLLAWTVGLIIIAILINLAQTVQRQRREISDLTPEPVIHRHLRVEPPATDAEKANNAPRTLTSGTETAR